MTREEVIRLAKEAGFLMLYDQVGTWLYAGHFAQPQPELPALERFAALVAAAEREECAKVCEGRIGGAVQDNEWWRGFKEAMKQCATMIRVRKGKS